MERTRNRSLFAGSLNYQALLFWLALPLLNALQMSLTPSDMGLLSRAVFFFYGWGNMTLVWAFIHVSTLVVSHSVVSASWKEEHRDTYLAGLGVLTLGCMIGSLIAMGTQQWRADVYCYLASWVGDPCYDPALLSWSWDTLGNILRHALINLQFWLIANYVLALLFKTDRYGFKLVKRRAADTSTQDDLSQVSPLLSRLPYSIGTDVIALEAKQHYVEVHTSKGSALVLYRLSDAIQELGDRGVQIHRSYWVSFDAVERIKKTKGAYTAELSNGLSFPISRAYQYALKSGPLAQYSPHARVPVKAKMA